MHSYFLSESTFMWLHKDIVKFNNNLKCIYQKKKKTL